MVVTDSSPSDQTARIVAVELRSRHEQVLHFAIAFASLDKSQELAQE
jgi:hypothetical protein